VSGTTGVPESSVLLTVTHYPGGTTSACSKGRTASVFDTALDEQADRVAVVGQSDVDTALAVTHSAFPA